MSYVICKDNDGKIYTASDKLAILTQVYPTHVVEKDDCGGSEEYDGAGNLIANWHWFNRLKDGEVCRHVLFEGNGHCTEYGKYIGNGIRKSFYIHDVE